MGSWSTGTRAAQPDAHRAAPLGCLVPGCARGPHLGLGYTWDPGIPGTLEIRDPRPRYTRDSGVLGTRVHPRLGHARNLGIRVYPGPGWYSGGMDPGRGERSFIVLIVYGARARANLCPEAGINRPGSRSDRRLHTAAEARGNSRTCAMFGHDRLAIIRPSVVDLGGASGHNRSRTP